MSRTRLISALLISITLIGGASWFRFARTKAYQAQLVAVQQNEQLASQDVFLEGILEAPVAPRPVSTEPLSTTDIVSRQLFSDYINLSSQGQISSNELNSLAEKYAGSILTTTLSANKIEIGELIIVSDSEENFLKYGQTLATIRAKYKVQAENHYESSGIGDLNSPAFQTFMSSIGKLYQSSSQELLSVAVPASLAENHRRLINNHRESALAMTTLAKMDEDPVIAYTAMTTQTKKSKEEGELLLNIQSTLLANGVMFGIGI